MKSINIIKNKKIILIFLATLLCLSTNWIGLAREEFSHTNNNFKATTLWKIPKKLTAYYPEFPPLSSDNGKHIAVRFRNEKDSTDCILHDQNVYGPYSSIHSFSMVLSPDGKTLIYRMSTDKNKKNQINIFINGEKTGSYQKIKEEPRFTANNNPIFVGEVIGTKKETVVANGKEGKHYDTIEFLELSGNYKYWAYIAREQINHISQQFIVFKGKEKKIYDESTCKNDFYSPWIDIGEEGTLTYSICEEEKVSVVSGKKKSQAYDDVSYIASHSSGNQLYYIAKKDQKKYFVINGKEEGPYDDIYIHDSVVSNSHYAYPVRDKGTLKIILDGKEMLTPYQEINNLIFSSDGYHLGYSAKSTEGWVAVINGKEISPPYAKILGPYFSPNGQRFAYIATPLSSNLLFGNQKKYFVVDKKKSRSYDLIFSPPSHENLGRSYFSADSTQIIYAASRDGNYFLVINGEESKPYTTIRSLALSSDGKNYCFISGSRNEDKLTVVINGKERKKYDAIYKDPVFLSPHRVAYGAYLNNEFLWVTEELN